MLGLSALAATEASAVIEMLESGIKIPPRSINDITRMLADYRQQDELIQKLKSIADAPAPSTQNRNQLFDFYWKRGQAAGELGRVEQQLTDLHLAVDNGQTGAPEYARALRNLAYAEVQGGNYLSALHFVDESIRQIPQSSRGQLTGAYAHSSPLPLWSGILNLPRKTSMSWKTR